MLEEFNNKNYCKLTVIKRTNRLFLLIEMNALPNESQNSFQTANYGLKNVGQEPQIQTSRFMRAIKKEPYQNINSNHSKTKVTNVNKSIDHQQQQFHQNVEQMQMEQDDLETKIIRRTVRNVDNENATCGRNSIQAQHNINHDESSLADEHTVSTKCPNSNRCAKCRIPFEISNPPYCLDKNDNSIINDQTCRKCGSENLFITGGLAKDDVLHLSVQLKIKKYSAYFTFFLIISLLFYFLPTDINSLKIWEYDFIKSKYKS